FPTPLERQAPHRLPPQPLRPYPERLISRVPPKRHFRPWTRPRPRVSVSRLPPSPRRRIWRARTCPTSPLRQPGRLSIPLLRKDRAEPALWSGPLVWQLLPAASDLS